jgi:hypothetical protein
MKVKHREDQVRVPRTRVTIPSQCSESVSPTTSGHPDHCAAHQRWSAEKSLRVDLTSVAIDDQVGTRRHVFRSAHGVLDVHLLHPEAGEEGSDIRKMFNVTIPPPFSAFTAAVIRSYHANPNGSP